METTGTIIVGERYYFKDGYVIIGMLMNDNKGRFHTPCKIRTSVVINETPMQPGPIENRSIVETLNSKYDVFYMNGEPANPYEDKPK